jgi:hypothetical protein
MPVYPIEFAPPALLGGYPNMQRRDALIWEAFLRTVPVGLERVAYNVALGGVAPNDPTASEAMLRGFAYSTASKPDVVCDFGAVWWVCEVKPSATLGAVGQALGYTLMAEREALTELPMLPTIITDAAAPDLIWVCEQLDINLVQVGITVPTTRDLPFPAGSGILPEEVNNVSVQPYEPPS